jgi:hypothetical protein
MGRLGRFLPLEGTLQHIGRQMKNLQPSAISQATDLELPARPIDGLQPAAFVQALNQGQNPDCDAVAVRAAIVCAARYEESMSRKRSCPCPSSQPIHTPWGVHFARLRLCGFACAPAAGARIIRRAAIARRETIKDCSTWKSRATTGRRMRRSSGGMTANLRRLKTRQKRQKQFTHGAV